MENQSKCYVIAETEEYLSVNLHGDCAPGMLRSFEEEIASLQAERSAHMVINCENLLFLSQEWMRGLLKLQTALRGSNKAMRFIMVPPSIKQLLKKNGMDSAFKAHSSLREALIDLGLASKKTLDTQFINPFLTATLNVLQIQAGVTAEAKKPRLKSPEEELTGDVSGIIAIVSENFNGTVVISFPESTFLEIMTKMLGEPCTTLSKEIIDGAGEITNMIFGQAKITLNEQGHGIKTAIPSVICGKDHSLSSHTKGPVVVIPFTGNSGDFFVEICLSE